MKEKMADTEKTISIDGINIDVQVEVQIYLK